MNDTAGFSNAFGASPWIFPESCKKRESSPPFSPRPQKTPKRESPCQVMMQTPLEVIEISSDEEDLDTPTFESTVSQGVHSTSQTVSDMLRPSSATRPLPPLTSFLDPGLINSLRSTSPPAARVTSGEAMVVFQRGAEKPSGRHTTSQVIQRTPWSRAASLIESAVAASATATGARSQHSDVCSQAVRSKVPPGQGGETRAIFTSDFTRAALRAAGATQSLSKQSDSLIHPAAETVDPCQDSPSALHQLQSGGSSDAVKDELYPGSLQTVFFSTSFFGGPPSPWLTSVGTGDCHEISASGSEDSFLEDHLSRTRVLRLHPPHITDVDQETEASSRQANELPNVSKPDRSSPLTGPGSELEPRSRREGIDGAPLPIRLPIRPGSTSPSPMRTSEQSIQGIMGSPGTQGTPGLSTLGEGFLQNNILHHWATSMIDGVLALLAKDDARPTLTMELVSLPPEDVPVEEVAVERTQHAEPLASSERDGMAREEDLESRVSEGSLPSLEEIFAEFSARSQSARVEGSMRQEDATVQVPTPILRSVRSEYDQGSGETETNPDLMRDEVVIPPGPPPLVPWESLTSTQCFPDRPDVPTFQDAVVLEAKDMGPSSDALPHRHDESRSSDSEIADPKVELAVLSRSSDDSSFSIDEDGYPPTTQSRGPISVPPVTVSEDKRERYNRLRRERRKSKQTSLGTAKEEATPVVDDRPADRMADVGRAIGQRQRSASRSRKVGVGPRQTQSNVLYGQGLSGQVFQDIARQYVWDEGQSPIDSQAQSPFTGASHSPQDVAKGDGSQNTPPSSTRAADTAVLKKMDHQTTGIPRSSIHRVDVESEAPVTDLPPGAVVWMDADPAAGYPVGRAVSRAELEEFRRQHGMVGTFAEESGDSEEDEDDKLPASQGATPGHHGHEEDRELENAAQGSRGRVRFADDAAHQPEHDGHQQGHEARASAYSALTHRPRQPGPTRANRYEMYFYAVSQPSEAPQPPVQASETSFRQEPPEETTHFVYHVYRTAWKGDAQEEHAKPILQGEYLKPDEATRAAYRELYRLHAATTPDGLGLFDEVNTSREEETGMLTMTGTSDTHGSVMVFVQRVLVADAAAGSAYTAPARVVPKMVYTVWETVTKGPDDGTATVTTTSRDEIYTHLQTANSAAFGVLKRHLRRLYPSGRIPLSQQILQTEATQRAHRLLIKADSQGKCFDANLGIFFDRHNGREAGEVFEEDERCMEARVWVMARPLHGPHN